MPYKKIYFAKDCYLKVEIDQNLNTLIFKAPGSKPLTFYGASAGGQPTSVNIKPGDLLNRTQDGYSVVLDSTLLKALVDTKAMINQTDASAITFKNNLLDVKIDGTTITRDSNGVLHSPGSTPTPGWTVPKIISATVESTYIGVVLDGDTTGTTLIITTGASQPINGIYNEANNTTWYTWTYSTSQTNYCQLANMSITQLVNFYIHI